MRVCDLLDQENACWDEELVRFVFDPDDAKEILSIPIRPEMEDWVAWHFDSKGVFSVKSAYRLGVSLRDARMHHDTSSSAAPAAIDPLWNKLWSLKLPGKVKMFCWRLCHNSLPTRMNIKRKRVDLDTRCPMCNRADEDGGHLFLKCKHVKPVWRTLLLEDVREKLLYAPNSRAMFETIWSLPSDQQQLVLVLLWDWWTTRNKKNSEGKDRSAAEVCHAIQRHVLDFQSSNPSLKTSQIQQPKIWTTPCIDHVKINFDAAFLKESGAGAWGFVVRSDAGEFVAAAAGQLKNLRDSLQAEAEACVAASEGAAALGLNRVIF
jgi:hypothetical protein